MSIKIIGVVALMLILASCAHHTAIRVQCQGPLRPINPPAAPLFLSPPVLTPSFQGTVSSEATP